jgi:hypothetical protein
MKGSPIRAVPTGYLVLCRHLLQEFTLDKFKNRCRWLPQVAGPNRTRPEQFFDASNLRVSLKFEVLKFEVYWFG